MKYRRISEARVVELAIPFRIVVRESLHTNFYWVDARRYKRMLRRWKEQYGKTSLSRPPR